MKTNESSSWEDLVFEKRNKEYGAYTIRQSYSTHVTEAIAGSVILVALVLIYPKIASLWGGDKVIYEMKKALDPTITISVVPKIDQLVKPAVHQRVTKKPSTSYRVTTEVPAEPKEIDKPADASSPNGSETGQPIDVVSTGTSELPVIPAVVKEPVTYAEFMPAYEGGMQAMSRFVTKHLKYPHHRDQEGKVYVQFVIDETGSVTRVEVIRGIGQEYDKEAARVVSMMPKWKPGRQGDIPVAVRMVLPINFILQ